MRVDARPRIFGLGVDSVRNKIPARWYSDAAKENLREVLDSIEAELAEDSGVVPIADAASIQNAAQIITHFGVNSMEVAEQSVP